jgi:large subunit ribosomal protein L25
LELIELNATIRKTKGNSAARALRREAQFPAVLYGPNTEPVSLVVVAKDLEKILKIHPVAQVLFSLVIRNGGTSTRPAMIKELQIHPISRVYLHADFYEIDMARKIRVKIPVVATGKSVGVEMGGMLQIVRHELEVLCLPMAIPESIRLDVTDLGIGDSIHVEDITLEGDVEIPADTNFTVLTISSPKVEGQEVGEEGVEGEERAGGEPSVEDSAETSDGE